MTSAQWVYHRPTSVTECLELLDRFEDAAILGGGTDLVGLAKRGIVCPGHLISIRHLAVLSGIDIDPAGALLLPAGARLSEIAADPRVREGWPILSETIGRIATPLIRNLATLGGNLCQRPRCRYFRHKAFSCRKKGGRTCHALSGHNRYHAIFSVGLCAAVHPSDLAPTLVALDATIICSALSGERRIPASEFYFIGTESPERDTALRRDEMIVGISVPPLPPGTGSAFIKAAERQSIDFALASVAVLIRPDLSGVDSKVRIVAGSVAWAPVILETSQAVATAAIAEARPLLENVYKLELLERITVSGLRRAAARASG